MPIVKLQNGTYVDTDQLNWSPSAGGGSMYDATRLGATPPTAPSAFLPFPTPQPLPGLKTRTVQTVGVDNNGNPILTAQPTMQPGMFGRISPPSVPGPSQFALMNQRDRIEDKPAPQVAQAPYTTDATNALDMSYYGLTPSASSDNSALGAIDDLTGSKRDTLQPFPLMGFNSPRYTPPIDITVNGGAPEVGSAYRGGWGSTGFVLPDMNKDAPPPMPRARPAPPMPDSYKIRPGDNLETLAKRFNTTVAQIANANGISNPNRIRAGATLNLGYLAPPVPRMPPAALGRGYGKPKETRAERFTNLDEFGMIR